ncbi:hypothetical protein B0H11DRAFT_1933985 [Mycena galericulata]|nr:hypothetical protein B0H11DRAFT_1933985 [Mycena galericulata]
MARVEGLRRSVGNFLEFHQRTASRLCSAKPQTVQQIKKVDLRESLGHVTVMTQMRRPSLHLYICGFALQLRLALRWLFPMLLTPQTYCGWRGWGEIKAERIRKPSSFKLHLCLAMNRLSQNDVPHGATEPCSLRVRVVLPDPTAFWAFAYLMVKPLANAEDIATDVRANGRFITQMLHYFKADQGQEYFEGAPGSIVPLL